MYEANQSLAGFILVGSEFFCQGSWSFVVHVFNGLWVCGANKNGAEGGSRTRMGGEARWILSPLRLPIPPPRHTACCVVTVKL